MMLLKTMGLKSDELKLAANWLRGRHKDQKQLHDAQITDIITDEYVSWLHTSYMNHHY